MNNTNENVLKIDNLSICFDINGKKCHAIRDLNLTVNAGELVALVGESGCGKNTLCVFFDGTWTSNRFFGTRKNPGKWSGYDTGR